MDALISVESLISLLTLASLEIVLGVDNVIFVSILMGRMRPEERLKARRIWMIVGIIARILLIMALGWLVNNGSKELIGLDLFEKHYSFNLRNIIMLLGGLFLLYKTVKELHQKLEGDEHTTAGPGKKSGGATFGALMAQIIVVDMVFSFDSIITAVGMARHVEIMALAVIIAMVIMFVYSERISNFIHKHPTLKMLALSFLLMVGFTLFFEGLEPFHHAHIPKGYIYFAMAFSFGVELLNMWVKKKESRRNPVQLREPTTDMIEGTEK
ncbi:TerC family protein [Gynurincola endophyticus]|jgi:predicted tellurium resistance membrane protein TerC|uniref:TerC family protein n=1 Tax=Gynurincola endophyticus TaxID=2479004 RepID=UPI000F8D7A7C|nr:TerC family protein [Gynurincola endophyticus]